MTKRLAPPCDLPPEKWQEILAVVVEEQVREDGFDVALTAAEAGLTESETAVFAAWVKEIEIRDQARQMGKEIGITTDRLLDWLEKNPGKPLPEE